MINVTELPERDQRIVADLQARGFRVSRRGLAWLIEAEGVELRVTELRHVTPDDLKPGQVRYQPVVRSKA